MAAAVDAEPGLVHGRTRCELASFTCNFALQWLALRTKAWFPVVTAGLAGNAGTDSLPGSPQGLAVKSRTQLVDRAQLAHRPGQ
jgi:hypothetical protein